MVKFLLKKSYSRKDQEKKANAKEIESKLNNKEFTIKKLSTENKELYGSVKPTEISKIIKEQQNIDINPSMIQLSKEIKTLGLFDVILNLHSEVQSKIKINVVAQEEN